MTSLALLSALLCTLAASERCSDGTSYCLGTCVVVEEQFACCPVAAQQCGSKCCWDDCNSAECATEPGGVQETETMLGGVFGCVDSLNVLQTELRLLLRYWSFGFYGRMLDQIWFLLTYYPWLRANCESF